MDNIITLTCGDWSNDGHGRTSSGTIRANLCQNDIVKAYKKGAKIIGVDISSDLCKDYQDNAFPEKAKQKYASQGMDFSEYDGEGGYLYPELFTKLYLFTVQVGNPEFKYEVVGDSEITIGGYGLFF